MLAELYEEPMNSEAGKTIMEVIGAKLDTICVKIDAIQAQVLANDLRSRECRTHCDDTSRGIGDRLTELEKRTLAEYAAKNATETLRREMEQHFDVAEDRRVQSSQTFWIRIGSIVAGTAILQTVVFYIIEKVLR